MNAIQRRRTGSRAAAAALGMALLALGFAACDDDEDAAGSGTAPGGASSTASSSSTPPPPDAPESEEDPAESQDEADDAVDVSGPACLIGTWLTDNDNVGAVLQGTAGDVTVSAPTGEALATFSDDGGHSVTYHAWTFEMSQQGATVQVVRDGTDEGTYRAEDDGQITTTDVDMGSVVTMTSPAGTHSTPGDPSTMTGTFICQGSTLKITVDGETTVMYRQ